MVAAKGESGIYMIVEATEVTQSTRGMGHPIYLLLGKVMSTPEHIVKKKGIDNLASDDRFAIGVVINFSQIKT
jgi:hypothetical protein